MGLGLKVWILIFAVLLCAVSIVYVSLNWPPVQSPENTADVAIAGTEDIIRIEEDKPEIEKEVYISEDYYIVKPYRDRIAVFKGTDPTPVVETEVQISGLRRTDAAQISRGIRLDSYEEVLYLLEDFNS